MKYRIKRVDSLYYAQVKGFIFWDNLINGRGSYEAAVAVIEWDKARKKGVEIIPYVDVDEGVNKNVPLSEQEVKWLSEQDHPLAALEDLMIKQEKKTDRPKPIKPPRKKK